MKLSFLKGNEIKTLVFENPEYLKYHWKQSITNGLDYKPIREEPDLRETSNERVKRHLCEIELRVLERERVLQRANAHGLFFLLSITEDVSKFAKKYYWELAESYEGLRKNYEEIREDLSAGDT